MDPVPIYPPEIILSDREDHRLFPTDRSASQEELHIHELSDSSVGQLCSSEPHRARMDEVASLRASTAGERRFAHSEQNRDTPSWTKKEENPNQQTLHSLPSLMMGPTHPQIQAHENPFNLTFMPSICPPLFNLQALSPGVQTDVTPLVPELRMTPWFGQEACWMNTTPNARCDFSPCVLFPYSPFSPPQSWFLLPEARPVWCVCPQSQPVQQPCEPDLLSRKAVEPVGEQLNVTPKSAGKEQSKEKAKSEEKQQRNDASDEELQSAESVVSPGSLLSLDEESLAERAFEEYMTIMDSLCPDKIHENVEVKESEDEDDEDGEKEKLETENSIFLEYLDELCSDEDFVRKVESTLDTEFLESLLSSDPDILDFIALEPQEKEATLPEQSHQPSANSSSDPITDRSSLLGSRLNAEHLDPPVSPDPESIDLFPLNELKQWVLEMTVQEQSHQLSADSISDPVPDQTSQTPILDPPGNSETNPNHDWQIAPLHTGSKERQLPTDGSPEHFSPVDALSSLCHDGSLFMENTFTLSPHSAPDVLTFDLETADHDVLAALFLADDSGPIVSEDAAMSLSNFANTQSAQLSQKTKSGPLPWEPTASESPSSSSVAGSTEDPPAPHFSADLLTNSQSQSAGPQALRVLARKALPPPLIRESEDQHSPRHINPESSCLKDMSPKNDLNNAIPAPASSSSVADSHPDSSDAQVDGNSSGSVPEEQILESPEGLPISQELASPRIFSEFRTRERRVTEKKCENILEKGARTSETPKKTARKAREEGMAKMSFEQKEENKENETKLVKVRRSQRLSVQNEKEKAGLIGGFKTERSDERKPSERSIKKDGVIYEKQSRRSSGGRQLCKREESNFEERSQGTKITHTVEQFSEMGKNEQHQKLRVEIQRLELESLPSHCSPASADKVENTLSTTTPQEKSEKDEESIKRKQEGIQISGFVRRRTRSITTEEKAQLIPPSASGDGRKSQHSQMETSEIEASPEREMQDKVEVNVKEYANESVSSPVKRSRSREDEEESSETANDTNKDLQIKVGKVNEDSANLSTVSPPTASSQQSPGVQTAPPTDMIMIDQGGQKAPGEAPLNDRDEHKHPLSSLESPSVKNPKLSPSLDPESIQLNQQQGKTVALSEDGAGGHSEVMQTKTCDFYSSTSPKPKVSSRKPSPDQTEDGKGEGERANGEEAKHSSLPLSPMKRYRQEHEASEETKVNETENVGIETEIIKSPMKRARWKIKREVDSRRAEKQRQTWIEKGDEGSSNNDETFGVCTPRTRSKTKAVDKLISNPSRLTGQETFEGEKTAGKTPSRDERSATKTRMSLRRIQVPRFPSKKQRRLSKLPTKYTDFILHKPKVMGKKRREKEKQKEVGKRRTTQTAKST